MVNKHIVRVKPQLVRKRTQVVIPKNVSVVIKPSRAQVVNLKDLKRQVQPAKPLPQSKAEPAKPQPQAIPVAAVARQKLIKSRRSQGRKKTEVKYLSRDVNPESINRIASLRNAGRGKLLIIVGNGPSILEADLDKLRNNPIIQILTVNKPDARLWPTDYWAFFDSSQFRRHEDLWNGYGGTIFNSTAIKRQKATSMQLKNKGGKGWSRDLLTGIHIGRSSVFASMQIAAWMNHEHVYIFGCDMSPEGINGKLHFYGQNPDVDPEQRKQRFAKEAAFYDQAADIMSTDERLKFTFCSAYNKHSFVDKFQRLDHREAVERILAHATLLSGKSIS